ncbi:hypothetical protein MPSEU_001017800 [Mayamaea pseudoterrestris]|nr:hypothetical protein MPSEU_001017800 [Mayamaea pseudoterrestris]
MKYVLLIGGLKAVAMILCRLAAVHSFAPLPTSFHRQVATMSTNSLSMSSTQKEGGPWKLPNDFETFLNQCTIQSFMFLLKSLRDPQTILWIERFTEPAIKQRTKQANAEPSGGSSDSRLLSYHGLAAMNMTVFPTWQSYFDKLLEQPIELQIIESHTAWAPDYEHEINPPRLCSRIISVREQIAREWVGDLAVIANMGGYTLEAYRDQLREERKSHNADPSRSSLRRMSNLLFLEFDPMMSDDYMPSPLRKGNFDLLCLLTTQEAVHRVLNEPTRSAGGEEQALRSFLRNFYASRLSSHFTGSKWYGMADDFLDSLLNEPPRTVQVGSGMYLVDPVSVGALVLETRQTVAMEWQVIAKDVPNRHLNVKRKQLNLLMGAPIETTVDEPFQ